MINSDHLYTFSAFAKQLETNRGKTGVSVTYLKRILKNERCNFEAIKIHGINLIHAPNIPHKFVKTNDLILENNVQV